MIGAIPISVTRLARVRVLVTLDEILLHPCPIAGAIPGVLSALIVDTPGVVALDAGNLVKVRHGHNDFEVTAVRRLGTSLVGHDGRFDGHLLGGLRRDGLGGRLQVCQLGRHSTRCVLVCSKRL